MGHGERARALDILLVEDSPGDARLAKEALEEQRLNKRLHRVSDGVEAMAFLRRTGQHASAPRPDLILLDLNLPGKDGREVLAEIKAHPDLRRIPVVVLSASRAEEDIARCYDLRANCYISKPTDWDRFSEAIRSSVSFWFSHARLPGRREATRPRSVRVLLVEDNPGDVRLVQEMLADGPGVAFDLTHVGRIEDGVRRLEQEKYDAVLLDLSLPDAQGLESLGRLHRHAARLPVLVLTGLEDEGLGVSAISQGAQDYLVKGRFDGPLLGRSVRHAMERMRGRRMLERLAHHDSLTRLPNRVLLHDRLTQALEQARRNKEALAVLFIDLDHFKSINDSLGHAAGDRLLQCVAERLKSCVRASDTVARLAGDEFTVLLPDVAHVDDVIRIAEKILASLRLPIDTGGGQVTASASLGTSLYPSDGEDAETLLKRADTAMYRAKKRGGNRHQFYSQADSAIISGRAMLSQGLRRALEREEFTLYYLPTVDAGRRIIGMEALLRWRHPDWGLLRPLEFIPLAEETGLIVDIGHWVLRAACQQRRAWQEAGLHSLMLCVNLSNRQLSQGKILVDTLARVLGETGLNPACLQLDVTESGIRQDETVAMQTLREVRAMGVSISIDDFGTGYSSLGRLRHFSIGSVKIDRSFIRDITSNPEEATSVKAMIAMGHGLGMQVLAEGVETEEQLTFLVDHKIDQLQGHYISKPMPAEACSTLLAAAQPASP